MLGKDLWVAWDGVPVYWFLNSTYWLQPRLFTCWQEGGYSEIVWLQPIFAEQHPALYCCLERWKLHIRVEVTTDPHIFITAQRLGCAVRFCFPPNISQDSAVPSLYPLEFRTISQMRRPPKTWIINRKTACSGAEFHTTKIFPQENILSKISDIWYLLMGRSQWKVSPGVQLPFWERKSSSECDCTEVHNRDMKTFPESRLWKGETAPERAHLTLQAMNLVGHFSVISPFSLLCS